MDPSEPSAKKSKRSKSFQYQWYDDHPQWLTWMKECPSNPNKFYCVVCDKTLSCGHTEIDRHSKSGPHLKQMAFLELDRIDSSNIAPSTTISSASPCSQEPNSSLSSSHMSFNERVQDAEIKFAVFIAENNIPMSIAPKILKFFKSIGQEPAVLQSMTMGRTKVTNVINNVVSVHETQRIVDILKKTKFSVYVDETTDSTNNKWMTLQVRYVDPNTFLVKTELLKLIELDAVDCSAEQLFKTFNAELSQMKIPLQQVIGVASDNASVMVGNNKSFKTFITKCLPHLVTLPCICHSLAIIASKACSAIPEDVHRFIRLIPNFIHASSKRRAIFDEFQKSFENCPKILRFAETRWLSRQIVICRILDNWLPLHGFLIDQSLNKIATADDLLENMNKPMTKAYLLFLKFALDSFNKINAHFQGSDTLIHQLQPSSKHFLLEILKRFIKPAFLKPAIFDKEVRNINFHDSANQLAISEVDVGDICKEYLQIQQSSGISEADINQVRSNCIKFYAIASKEIRERLPFEDKFLSDLTVFTKEIALLDSYRESSFARVKNICLRLNVPEEKRIDAEWSSLYCVDPDLKERWCQLSFDDMWMEISTFTNSDGIPQFPSLRLLSSMIRALPHSNAAAERAFSLIPDTKTKKRNKLSSKSLNSISVIRSATQSRNLSATEMSIDKSCLKLMSSSNVYTGEPKSPLKRMNVYAYESSDDWEIDESENS